MTVSVRLMNCLKEIDGAITSDDMLNLEKLSAMSDGEFLRIPNFGRKSLNELKELLKLERVHLNPNDPLYITPFKPSKHHERNIEIYNMRKNGELLRVLGEKHGITRERVRQIFLKIQRIQKHSRYKIEGALL